MSCGPETLLFSFGKSTSKSELVAGRPSFKATFAIAFGGQTNPNHQQINPFRLKTTEGLQPIFLTVSLSV
jgi:hypothetical protein